LTALIALSFAFGPIRRGDRDLAAAAAVRAEPGEAAVSGAGSAG